MSNLLQFLRRLAATFRGRNRAEAELDREMRSHLQFLEDTFLADGMTPEEAHFAAKRAFGNVGHTKELQRDARSFPWLTGWAMEWKLGARMLLRYPGLTIAGGLAMAFAILVGATIFEVVTRATHPVLPLPDGQRIVGLTYWDQRENVRKPASSYDFLKWRDELTTVREIGAFRLAERNLAPAGSTTAEPVTVVQMSPSAFRIARTPPLLGRALLDADAEPGAPPVVVLGHVLWQSRFNADATIIGRQVRLGGQPVTVVGIMPEGFAFPVDDNIWIPLRPSELSRDPGRDALKIFGRLEAGRTLAEAQAEMSLIATRAAADYPDIYTQLTPQALPYANSILWLPPDLFTRAGIQSVNAFAVLMWIVICGNVALLMLTRTATREKEILLRTALGATHGRILTQLLFEALLLAAIALALGLAGTRALLSAVVHSMNTGADRWPFWLNAGLSPSTVIYAGMLTLFAAIIVGVVPGLKVMGKESADRLRQSNAGTGGLRMGKLWTGLVITQIAATVLFTATAYVVHRQSVYLASVKPVFPAAKYLSVRLAIDEEHRAEFSAAIRELERRLSAETVVAGVALGEQLPLMATTSQRAIRLQSQESARHVVGTTAVAPNLFKVFQMPLLAGRTFHSQDQRAGANTIIVNSLFAEKLLGGKSAVGQRIRYEPVRADQPGPWLEIVGVVQDLVPDAGAPLNLDNPARPRLYHCLNPGEGANPIHLAILAKSDPRALSPMLRRIAGEVSPSLQLHDILPLEHAVNGDTVFWRAFADGCLAGSAVLLFLSLTGIYSVTSFNVSRRTREIGVRVALGASAPRVIAHIFHGPLLQVAAGVATGCTLLALITLTRGGTGIAMLRQGALLLLYGIAVMIVCALACVGPALRALRVDPVEALRDDT